MLSLIQVYYLSTQERKERFRTLFDRLDVIDTFFPLDAITSLTAFITRDKAISQQQYILCDLVTEPWSDEHILSAVQMLRRFAVTRFVFISPDNERTATLYKRLADMLVDGLMIDKEDISTELSAILQGDGGYLRRLDAIRQGVASNALEQAPPLRIPAGLMLDIAVGGAMHRVGTTAQTIALYHYLRSMGFRPALLDQGQDAWRLIRELCPQQSAGLAFVAERTPDFNCYLSDYGVMKTEIAQAFCNADLSVLVGGGKPWELTALANAFRMVTEARPRELVTLLSFVTDEEADTVRQFIPNCASVPYHPDIWTAGSDSVYRETVLPALKRLCTVG